MICGTTPTHVFTIPFSTTELKEVRVTYSQHANTVAVQKETSDCTMDGNTISVTLTQEDTLKFNDMLPVKIQLKVLTTGGCVLAAPVIRKNVMETLCKEVLA